MRRDDAVAGVKQRIRRSRWLHREHVEPRAGEATGLQRRCEIGLDDERAARRVHEEGGRLHERDPFRVDEALRLRRERAVQAHHVALAQEALEPDALGFVARRAPVREHAHAERAAHGGDPAADPAVPHDPERPTGQLDQVPIPVAEVGTGGPATGPHRRGMVSHAVGEFEQEREGRLHDVGRGVLRHVADRDAPLAGRVHVDDVEPRGEHADVAESRQRRDVRPGHALLVREEHVGSRSPGHDLVGGRAVVHHELTERLERGPGGVTGIGRQTVEDHDLHGWPHAAGGTDHETPSVNGRNARRIASVASAPPS